MPLVQDRSLDLLTSSSARDHGTMDAPEYVVKGRYDEELVICIDGAGRLTDWY